MNDLRVVKRDGSVVSFSKDKIYSAIKKAFQSAEVDFNKDKFESIYQHLNIRDNMSVEDIQNQVEMALMKNKYFKIAKSYILYREKHKNNRELIKSIDFINGYINSDANNASVSKYDANANVTAKNLVTLMGELPKKMFIDINRKILTDRIKSMYGKEYADRYLYLLNNHFIYKNDETNLSNYCASITMYPFLLDGTKKLGGITKAPTNLKSYCGNFVNLVFMVSSMLSGAVATPEFLMYMDYFIRKEYGEDYYKETDKVVDLSNRNRTLDKVITDYFEQVVYSINQPAGTRNYQSVFWNVAYYDKPYFEAIFGTFYFPDGTKPKWESLSWLQKKFMKWFNEERLKVPLTFPVETMALLSDGEGNYRDEEYADFTTEMYSEGHSFFTYVSDNADSLSSCCRLRNEITDNEFSYTLGAGGVSTGSKSVMTVNINRCVQYAVKNGLDYLEFINEVVSDIHKFQLAYDENLKEFLSRGMLPLFDAGFIDINRQYLTVGVNGIVEGAEFLGLDITENSDYQQYVDNVLGILEKNNKEYKQKYNVIFNTEMIPGESVGIKHSKWDKEDGYETFRDCYNSYFYKVEDDTINIIDKFKLHGKKYVDKLTGGSALHCNINEHLSKEQYKQLLKVASKEGTNYFTFNCRNTVCNDCGYIDKNTLDECPKCKSKNLDYLTRIIGYLKRVSNFSEGRQIEAKQRIYNKF